MKLHGNAALSWNGRRRLAERVVEQGWTLTAAAEAAGVSVRCARKWVARYRSDAGAARSLVGSGAGREQDGAGADRGDRGAAATAFHWRGDRRDTRDGEGSA